MKIILQSIIVLIIFFGCASKQVNDFNYYEIKSKIAYKFSSNKIHKFDNFREYEDSNNYQKGIITKINIISMHTPYKVNITLRMNDKTIKVIQCIIPQMDLVQENADNVFKIDTVLYFIVDKNNLATSYLSLYK